MSWLWLLLSIGCEVTGTLSLRASDGFRRPRWLIPMAASYIAAFTFLGLTLHAGMAVGVAYGLWTAIGIILIALLANRIWGEPISRRMAIGIALIIIGVVLVELG